MVVKVIQGIGAAALGILAVYAGYSAFGYDSGRGAEAGADISVAEDLSTRVFEGVPEGTEALAFNRGQRADRIARVDEADDLNFVSVQDSGAGNGRQIRGLPETQTTQEPEEKPATTPNPVTADKKDDGKFFTTDVRRADKKDDGKFFTTNAKRVDKKDDGSFFTENTDGGEFDPCLKADGTPYQGPGTALNPFAPVSPCLPKATAENYAVLLPEEPEVETPTETPVRRRTVLPTPPEFFAPEPPLPGGGSDYRTI
ncbi:MAG: hypothetical protein AAGA69_10935 [Pseudomonadota bacterium]